MADFTFAVPDADRVAAARHFAQSYHLAYGSSERADAIYFGIPVEECLDSSPVAQVMRDVAAQLRSDTGPVRVRAGSLDAYGLVRLSELLRQTERRCQRDAERDGRPSELAAAVVAGRKQFEKRYKVPDDDGTRTQYLAWPSDPAAREKIKADAAARQAARRAEILRGERASMRVLSTPGDGGDEDGFETVGGGVADSLPASVRGRRT